MTFETMGGFPNSDYGVYLYDAGVNMYCHVDWTTMTAEAIDNPSSGTSEQCSAFMGFFKYGMSFTRYINVNGVGEFTGNNFGDNSGPDAYYPPSQYNNSYHVDLFPDGDFVYSDALKNGKIIVDYDKYPNVGTSGITWDQAGFTPKYGVNG